jgi:hypothetical protein
MEPARVINRLSRAPRSGEERESEGGPALPSGDERQLYDRLGRPGSDLLSRALRHSTIGAGGLNDRVRNGIGWGTPARTTRSAKTTATTTTIVQSEMIFEFVR